MPFSQCDASGLVKRYVDEVGSNWVRAIVDLASANIIGIIGIADITRAEVISALARRTREGVITPDERDELIQAFRAHCATQYRIAPTQPGIIDLASELLQQGGCSTAREEAVLSVMLHFTADSFVLG